jgi:polyphosphate kinase
MRDTWTELIETEIKNAKAGKEAYITLKLNSLADRQMIKTLYRASQAGVKIRLIVRGSCSLISGIPGLSENIEAISIVDRYLEHSRIFVFCNGGKPKYYISSADWMVRNLDHRVEVSCPIYNKNIRRELQTYLDIQWQDNTKARILNRALDNQYRRDASGIQVRSQEATYEWLKSEVEEE